MYVKQSKAANILGTINEGITGASNVMNYADQLMREKAKSDMFYAQAELERDQKIFLQNLTREGSYENYEKKASEFLQQQKSKLQKNAKNAYTADLYDQMLTSYRDNLYVTVQAAKLQKQIEDITLQDEASLNLNRQTMIGQAAINANTPILFSEYARGYRDQTYTKAAVIANAKDAISKDVIQQAQSKIGLVINQGGSVNDLNTFIDNYLNQNNYTVKMLASEYANEDGLAKALSTGEGQLDISGEVDKKTIAADVKKQIKQQYDLEVETRQNKNMNAISEWFSHLNTLSLAEQSIYAGQCLQAIEKEMSGNNLSSSQRIAAVNLFKTIASTTGITESKEAKEKVEEAKKEFTQETIKTDMESFLNDYLAGKYENAYFAEDAFRASLLEKYRGSKNDPTLSYRQLDEEFNVGRKFLEAINKRVDTDPNLKELKGLYKSLSNKLKELTDFRGSEDFEKLEPQLANIFWDSIYGLNLSNPAEVKAFNEYMTKEVNDYTAKELDCIRTNPKTHRSKLAIGADNDYEKPILEYYNEAVKHPGLVYTDIHGNEKVSIFGDENSQKVIERFEKEYLLENGFINNNFEVIKKSYETDGHDDIKPLTIYRDGNRFIKVRPNEDGTELNVYMTKTPEDPASWTQYPTKKQAEKAKKKDRTEFIKAESEEAAKKIKPTIFNAPPGVPQNDWIANSQKPEWISKKIQEVIEKYDKEKNARSKEKYKKWLEDNGVKY